LSSGAYWDYQDKQVNLARAAINSGRAVMQTLPAWIWLTGSGIVVYQVFYAWWLIVKPGGDEALLWFGDTVYLIAPAAATALLFLVASTLPKAAPAGPGASWEPLSLCGR